MFEYGEKINNMSYYIIDFDNKTSFELNWVISSYFYVNLKDYLLI